MAQSARQASPVLRRIRCGPVKPDCAPPPSRWIPDESGSLIKAIQGDTLVTVMAQLDCAIPLLSSVSDATVLASRMDGTVKLCHDGK